MRPRQRWRSVLNAFIIGLLGLVLGGLISPPTASAHAIYVRSEPPSGGQLAAPGRITAYFSEDVDPSFSELQVLDATLRRVDRRDTQPVPTDPRALTVSVPQLPDGTYTVSWRTLSAVDGHTVKGAFPLVVGEGGTSVTAAIYEVPPAPLEVFLRALTFLGTLVLVGGLAFGVLVVAPTRRALLAQVPDPDVQAVWERRFRRLGLLTIALLVLVGILWLALQVSNVTDVSLVGAFSEPMLRYLGTRNGNIWIAKTVILLLLALCLARGRGAVLFGGGLLLGGAYVLGTSLTSHAAAFNRGPELATAVDWLHQMSAALWLGGLVSALLILPELLWARPPARHALLAVVVPRLSDVATVSVIVLVASGLFGALLQVGSLEALPTVYGSALLFKIGALIPMLVLGALNKFYFTPRFARAASERVETGVETVLGVARRFRLGVVCEVLLGVAVLVATGVLTSAEPAREVWAREPKPIVVSGPADDLQVQLRIEPGGVGENTYIVTLRDAAGNPAADVQRVQLRFSYVDQALGRGTRTLERADGGTYRVTGNDLSIAGRWQVETAVRRLNREDAVAAFLVDIGVLTGPNGGSAFALPGFAGRYASLALALLIASLAGLAWVWSSRDLQRGRRPRLFAGCAVFAVLSGIVVVRSADFSRDLQAVRNPIPVTGATLAVGEQIYTSRGCVDCHGDTGRGDGPLGLGLRPQPADFRIHMAAGHTDGQLFDWVSNGVPGTAMPPFRDQLTEEERWLVINYIRNFANTTG